MPEEYPDIADPAYGFSGRQIPSVLRTSLQTGLELNRERYGTSRSEWRASWELTGPEFEAFREWFVNDLANGVLYFTAPWDSGVYRFVGGDFQATHIHGGFHSVTGTLEILAVNNAPINATPLVPAGKRLAVDPAESQQLGFEHRNAKMVVRPEDESTTTLRVYNPENASLYIWFGVDSQGLGETLITSEDADDPPAEAVPAWPNNLPLPDSGFQLEHEAQVVRHEMDSTHTRQQKRFQVGKESYRVTWTFTASELAQFQTFFFSDLKSGSKQVAIPLPVDGLENAVPVRFDGGYSERSQRVGEYQVTATLVRTISQIETLPVSIPYAQRYYPVVEISENTKVLSSDAGKMYVATVSEGNTINLHISDLNIEVGVLLIGAGNLLITRTPFVHTPVLPEEEVASEILAPTFVLETALVLLGEIAEEAATSEILAPTFAIESVIIEPEDTLSEEATSEIYAPTFELRETLKDQGEVAEEAATSEIYAPTFEIDQP